MSDEIEQKNEALKFQAPSDSLAKPSVISTREEEAIWDRMQQKDTKHESATHIGLTPEMVKDLEAKGLGKKFILFDSNAEESVADLQAPKAEQAIASNITPTVPNVEHMQKYEDVQRDIEPPKIPKSAQTFDYDGRPPTLVPSPEQLGMTPETVKALGRAAFELMRPWTNEHPLAEYENEIMAQTSKKNPSAWQDAKSAFPQLANVSVDIMRAYTRNEIANYDRFDLKDDIEAAKGQISSNPLRSPDLATLGISQISPKGVREFESRYPQFKAFLEEKGYTGAGHELAALLDRECAPIIVAAKTASIVEDMQKHGIEKPSAEQIAYAYNPDVFSYSDGKGGKIFKALYHPEIEISKAMHSDQIKEYYAKDPRVVWASKHIRNVMRYMP